MNNQPKTPVMQQPKNRRSTALLLAGVAALAATLYWRPWSPGTPTEARLRERFAAYSKARQASDWRTLYDLTDPQERQRVSYEDFVQFYGKDMYRLHDVALRKVQVDVANGKATTEMSVDMELIPERIPEAYRRNLKIEDKGALRQRTDHALAWVWRDRDWGFHMDRVVVTGRNSQGHVAVPGGAK